MKKGRRWMAALLMWVMVLTQLSGMTVRADAIVQQNQLVLTLGADLTAEQKAYILQHFEYIRGSGDCDYRNECRLREVSWADLISEEQIGNSYTQLRAGKNDQQRRYSGKDRQYELCNQ